MSEPVLATISRVIDAFIPGDADFPAASDTGASHLVLQRLLDYSGVAFLNETVDLLADQDAGAIIDSWQAEDPVRYEALRFVIYLSYYQQPEVIAALQRLGHDYNLAPQPLGYALPPFDPEKHRPAEPRGVWFTTDGIQPVDLSGLVELDLPKVWP
jgi:hypothetical protein